MPHSIVCNCTFRNKHNIPILHTLASLHYKKFHTNSTNYLTTKVVFFKLVFKDFSGYIYNYLFRPIKQNQSLDFLENSVSNLKYQDLSNFSIRPFNYVTRTNYEKKYNKLLNVFFFNLLTANIFFYNNKILF